jgi:HAD superfamily hydrolase (TIGR01493 family)
VSPIQTPIQEKRGPARVDGVLFDLLMAVMNSLELWATSAPDRQRGLAWRDAVTARMIAAGAYVPYEELVAAGAREVGLPAGSASNLLDHWSEMQPWPDAAALNRLSLPYGFVTNCSDPLARMAVGRSRLEPRFVLSAQAAGWYKPAAEIYREACLRLGSAPGRTLFVAGAPYDSVGAHRAGLQAAMVQRRRDQRTALDSAISVIRSLDELPEAVNRLR